MKVLLINPPFTDLSSPHVGLSTIKGTLESKNIFTDIAYPAYDILAMVGQKKYDLVINGKYFYEISLREWIFMEQFYKESISYDSAYKVSSHKNKKYIYNAVYVKDKVYGALDRFYRSIPWEQYDIIGITGMWGTMLAGFLMGRTIKEWFPDKKLIFGGSSWTAEGAPVYLNNYSFIDYACIGASETTLPSLVNSIRNGNSVNDIPNIVYRDKSDIISTKKLCITENMDEIAIPEFDDFFRYYNHYKKHFRLRLPHLVIECSRGCWWGECYWCALSLENPQYRSKSSERMIKELKYLSQKYNVKTFEMVDNILDMKYFNGFYDKIKDEGYSFFTETRANLKRKHFRSLRAAGADLVGIGLETFSDNILKCMNKGTNSMQNIQVLKFCREYNIEYTGNLLVNIPGETDKDYEDMLKLLPKIAFYARIDGYVKFRLDRYSTYFKSPERFGIKNIRIDPTIRYILKLSDADLEKTSFSFLYDAENIASDDIIKKLTDYVLDWPVGENLIFFTKDNYLYIEDTRRCAKNKEYVLDGDKKKIYEYFESVKNTKELEKYIDKSTIDSVIQWLEENNLMVSDNRSRYFSLAINGDIYNQNKDKNKWIKNTESKLCAEDLPEGLREMYNK